MKNVCKTMNCMRGYNVYSDLGICGNGMLVLHYLLLRKLRGYNVYRDLDSSSLDLLYTSATKRMIECTCYPNVYIS